jgi:hypothetical protein
MRTSLDHCHYCDRDVSAPQRLDARGIFISYVCDRCWATETLSYRYDVLANPGYVADDLGEDYD